MNAQRVCSCSGSAMDDAREETWWNALDAPRLMEDTDGAIARSI